MKSLRLSIGALSKKAKEKDDVLARYKDMLDFVTNSTDEEFGIIYSYALKSTENTAIVLMKARIQHRGYCQVYGS